MLEIPLDSRRAFVYIKGTRILEELHKQIGIKPLAKETYGELEILTVEVISDILHPGGSETEKLVPESIKCMHGEDISYGSLNLLPQEGWEELIDCWSCHNCEFKTMLDLVPKPRERGILVSDFFFLINNADLPSCCREDGVSIRKLFYNEVKLEHNHSMIVYSYLESYFSNRNTLLLKVNRKSYEIKYFYKATIVDLKDGILSRKEAIKVGIKETDKAVDDNTNMNEFYAKLIYSNAVSNSIDIEVLDYKISFIMKE